jgi:hypothetical protein
VKTKREKYNNNKKKFLSNLKTLFKFKKKIYIINSIFFNIIKNNNFSMVVNFFIFNKKKTNSSQ